MSPAVSPPSGARPLSAMDELIAGADPEILVEMVRVSQKQGLKGANGGWKEFLNHHDKMFGAGISDPARRKTDDLVAFLKTFTQEDDVKLFEKVVRCRSDRKAIEQFIKDHPDKETPQQRLVQLTMEHPNYTAHYSFPTLDQEWIVVPLGKISRAMRSKTMIAVDCEMVLCEDGTEAVVKICAVDHNLKVKLDQLVKPNKAISDYRTEITGISAKDLEGVTCSLIDIQSSLKKLLSKGIILVGHSLHNDLRALKVDHPRVIDTSYIFKAIDFPTTYTPSLNNLCKSVLGFEVRKEGEPHDCLHDAQATMKLVLAKLEHGFADPIPIASKIVHSSDLAKLCLHKIPIDIPREELLRLFPSDYNIDIQTDVRVRGLTYSTYAVFKDASEADEAFRRVEGHESKDTSGKLQKKALLRLSTGEAFPLYVRRMTPVALVNNDNISKKRPAQNEDEDPKRQRLGLQQCDLVQENEKLREQLRQKEEEIYKLENEKLREQLRRKEEEIFNLQKIVSALTRKHGL